MYIECGKELNPNVILVDTHSSGTDWRETRRPEDVVLYAICPEPSRDGSNTPIALRIPDQSSADIGSIKNIEDAARKLLSAPLYKCDVYSTRWCPLYRGPGQISYRELQIELIQRQVGK